MEPHGKVRVMSLCPSVWLNRLSEVTNNECKSVIINMASDSIWLVVQASTMVSPDEQDNSITAAENETNGVML